MESRLNRNLVFAVHELSGWLRASRPMYGRTPGLEHYVTERSHEPASRRMAGLYGSVAKRTRSHLAK
ncbi:hypothetical protein GL4_0791 [Methyloceanibacter caenitepidi]|uniref:Uncharacterized protein n=1 Tax=Methyloceanibacter caenitepidi TaxID=1384459 RepID=A0A0A8JZL4_9HYPH|nr:hypothetical protein GL4_0791 [Methyloceanibacter caenitepidi]